MPISPSKRSLRTPRMHAEIDNKAIRHHSRTLK